MKTKFNSRFEDSTGQNNNSNKEFLFVKEMHADNSKL